VTEQLLTYGEAAAVLRCSPATVKRRVANGALAVFTDNGLRRIREDDLRRFVSERVEQRGAEDADACPAGCVLAPGARLWD
jgi:excisionase family DNA binding protein